MNNKKGNKSKFYIAIKSILIATERLQRTQQVNQV